MECGRWIYKRPIQREDRAKYNLVITLKGKSKYLERRNGFTYKPWSSDYLNANVAMKGSLANYGTTTWTLSKIPLAY